MASPEVVAGSAGENRRREDELAIKRVANLAAVRPDWTRLAQETGNVFSTWEWTDAWHRHLGGSMELAIAAARRPTGETAAIFPLCLAREWPVRLVQFLGAGPSDQLGPLSAPADHAAAAAAFRLHLSEAIGKSGLFLGDCLWGADHLGEELGAVTVRRAPSPTLPIRGRTYEDFLGSRSRNFRGQVRRRERRLSREHRLVYRLTEDPARLADDMRTLMRLHEARWSHGESDVFTGRRALFHLEFAQRALENGWLRLWTMELDDVPVAAWYGLRYAGIECYYQAGRDPSLDQENVGFVLLCHTIRSAFEDGMLEYRFGPGGEPYKSRFAEQDPGVDTVALAAGTRGRLALAAVRSVQHLSPDVRGWMGHGSLRNPRWLPSPTAGPE